MKPISAAAPVPRLPFHDMLVAVTFAPDCDQFALQPWVTFCVPGKVNFSVQEDMASPRLVIFTLPPKPPPPQLFAV